MLSPQDGIDLRIDNIRNSCSCLVSLAVARGSTIKKNQLDTCVKPKFISISKPDEMRSRSHLAAHLGVSCVVAAACSAQMSNRCQVETET